MLLAVQALIMMMTMIGKFLGGRRRRFPSVHGPRLKASHSAVSLRGRRQDGRVDLHKDCSKAFTKDCVVGFEVNVQH